MIDDVRRHATAQETAPAVVDGGVLWTWADLDARVDAVAGAIAARYDAGSRIGLALGQTALGVAALHAVSRTGASALLVHPRLAAVEVTRSLEEAEVNGLVVDPGAGLRPPDGLDILDLDPDAVATGARGAIADRGELIVPTSGTTARPRLVRLPRDRIAASATAWNRFLPPATGWLLTLGLAHVAGVGIVARAALAGVPVVTVADRSTAALLDAIDGARGQGVVVSHLSLVASQLAALLDETGDSPPPDGIRAVILGGGPIPPTLIRRALDAGWPVVPSYGMTETSSGVVALPTDEARDHATTVGRPLPGVSVRIDDDGRIAVRGPMTFAGYLGDPPRSADAWVWTNDLGRLDADGRLVVIGRADDVIIRGGENVSPAEVEAALLDHPGIAEAAVVGVPDHTWGAVPIAVIVPAEDPGPDDAQLAAYLASRLARFKLPTRYVRTRRLPRTDLGKVIRPEVVKLATATTMIETHDGQVLAFRDLPAPASATEAPVIVLLHATLSTSGQLVALARRLNEAARVIAIDRRGSGESRMAEPGEVEVERHAIDVIEVLEQLGIERALLVGHSFGGVVALRVAIRDPARFAGLVVWEPPYLALADPVTRRAMTAMTKQVTRRYTTDGPEAAARRFLEAVSGPEAWERLHPRQRAAIGREGDGVLADVGMGGLSPAGLERIHVPTVVLTGADSDPFYRPIADAIAGRIGPTARRIDLPDLQHMAPITDADAVAVVVLDLLREIAS